MRAVAVVAVLGAACRIQDIDYTGKACPCPGGWTCDPASMTCARGVFPAGDAPGSDARPPPDVAPGTFAYRSRLTIHNAATASLPAGFTIRVPLDLSALVTGGKVRADYSDLRVIGDGFIGERDRIVDPAAGPAPAGLSFSLASPLDPGATTTAYALYYGSATIATAAPADGTAVFQVYDDFTTGISSIWLVNDTASASGGQLILHANHTDALTTNAATDNIPIVSAVELIATVLDPNSNPTVQTDGTFYYWFGYQMTGAFTPVADPWILWIARGKSGIGVEQKSPIGCESGCAPQPGTQTSSAHYYAIERDPGESRFYYDDAAAQAITVTNSTDYSLMVRNFMATSDVQIDYIRARARVSPDPTVTVGVEETL